MNEEDYIIMLLSKTKMQTIVEELRGSIDKDINIMDKTGYVIASTDPTRIGVHHQGAQRIIDQKMNELLIGDETCFDGARRGINLPIFYNEEIVGVVGITGEREEVEPFGKVIKKMTEILLAEEYQKDHNQLIENTKNNFVYTWLFRNLQENEEEREKFISGGRLLGIEVFVQRVVVVLYVEDEAENQSVDNVEVQMRNNRIVKRIYKMVGADEQNIVVQIGARIILLLHEENCENAYEKVKTIKNRIEPHYKIKVAGGIGSVGTELEEIRKSYKEAEMSCNLMKNMKDMGIMIHGDIDMEMLVHSIPDHQRAAFLNKILKSGKRKEIENNMLLLRCLVENNGSITNTANQLYLHKNTVQYRIGKIKELTGYDPRIMKEMVPLYIALLMYEENRDSQEDQGNHVYNSN